MIARRISPIARRTRGLLAAATAVTVLATGCAGGDGDEAASVSAGSGTDDGAATTSVGSSDPTGTNATATGATATGATDTAPADTSDLGSVGTLTSSEVHDVSVEFDEAEFEAMVATYTETGDKEWISATVTIDGITYENVGLRLKGNSSLRGVTTDDDPATIPWLIKLDEFVEDQDHEGLEELVIRSSSSGTGLNEAVALELLDLAGLASQDAIAVRFTVNGGDAVLRLAIDNPDGEWMEEWFSDTGALYKAESTGDWSYRGDDPEAYDEVFDQEAGKDNADLTPLIELLQFVDEADEATFEAELPNWLDVESFATYLAMQDLLDNFDDIDGPGNNAYLYWDTDTEQFTVVPWDYNLAFGQRPMGGPGGGDRGPGGAFPDEGGGRPTPPGGTFPEGMEPGMEPGTGPGQAPPDGAAPGTTDAASAAGDVIQLDPNAGGTGDGLDGGGFDGGPGGGGGMQRANPLVDRFLANEEWNAMYEQAKADLQAALYDSGTASAILDQWSAIVAGSGLLDQSQIDTDAAAIESYFG